MHNHCNVFLLIDTMKLLQKTLAAFLLGLTITSTLLFLPAGTLNYSGGWLFIGLLFAPILITGMVLWFKDPKLLQKRLAAKETEAKQRNVVALSGLLLIVSFVVAGLDFRFGWSHVADTIVIIASVALLISYALYAEVLRENAYLSRVVEVQTGQQIIDTGLYGIVRHPMYSAVSLLYLSIPLVLGSWWALLTIFPCVLLLAARIKNEEVILCQGLSGYETYIHKVRYRMVPWVW